MFMAFVPLLPTASAAEIDEFISIEWIPLRAHKEILNAVEAQWKETLDAPPKLTRINLFADDEELKSTIEKLQENPPRAVIGFGDTVCKALRDTCPEAPLIALFVRDPKFLEQAKESRSAPCVQLKTDPQASFVVHVAKALKPKLKRMAIIYTKNDAANTHFANQLEIELAKTDIALARAEVPSGFCRTDSDFEKAINKLVESGPIDILYVPDDPNCSRFGTAIYKAARKHNIQGIGTGATMGKGCVAGFTTKTNIIAHILAKISFQGDNAPIIENRSVDIDAYVVADKNAIESLKLDINPALMVPAFSSPKSAPSATKANGTGKEEQ
jgi:ABC-type uncharacterized transport system substrate-binding protein